jgi:hypothetical protein
LWFLDEHIARNTGRYWEIEHGDDGKWHLLTRSGLYQGFFGVQNTELLDTLWIATKITLKIEEELRNEGLAETEEHHEAR